ncbi:hypothetical protein PRIPAC_83835, partial [Pristionchus pacificus]|uniref:Uncharacterized protein n=1 Tax=Pristionchus pacificus TaxID=54126 RepID=A0A2A6BUS5_PRIPA
MDRTPPNEVHLTAPTAPAKPGHLEKNGHGSRSSFDSYFDVTPRAAVSLPTPMAPTKAHAHVGCS